MKLYIFTGLQIEINCLLLAASNWEPCNETIFISQGRDSMIEPLQLYSLGGK